MAIDANGNITSFAVTETLGAQTQANGINQVVVVDDIQANPGNGGNVVGTDYVGRVVILRRQFVGTTVEYRRVVSDVAGTGNTRILTMSEDWVVPPASGDEFNVFYNIDDLDGSGTSFAFDGRTGFYEAGEPLTVGNGTAPAGIWFGDGQLINLVDSKSTTNYALTINNNAILQVGLIREDTAVSGGYLFGLNNGTGEAFISVANGGTINLYDSAVISPITLLNFQAIGGSSLSMRNSSVVKVTNNWSSSPTLSILYKDVSFTGTGTSVEEIQFRALGSIARTQHTNITFNNVFRVSFISVGSTAIYLKNCKWIGMTEYLFINITSFSAYIVNPSWGATSSSDFSINTGSHVYQCGSIEPKVVDVSSSPIANAVVAVYEGLITQNLERKLVTNSLGTLDDYFIYKDFISTGVTVYGNHALRVDKWTYNPFATAFESSSSITSSITLTTDTFISETNQATALSNGSGITWNEDTNPSSLIEFTLGTGTLSVGQTVTGGTSGATGIVTQILDGDSVEGTVHLRSRNGVSFSASETISNGSGWNATFTSGSELRYSIWIDGNSLSLQTVYDYLAALTSQTTLSATGELIHEWGNQNQARALYSTGSTFFTERSGTMGVIVVNATGNVDKYTADNGGIYTPPVQYTFSLTGLKDGTEIRIYNSTTKAFIAGIETIENSGTATTGVTTSGTLDDRTFTYSYVYGGTDIPIFIAIISENYEIQRLEGLSLSNQNQSIPVQQRADRNFNNP